MHLLPAAITLAISLVLAPLMSRLHWPPTFGLTLAFAFILIPIELGLLLRAAHKATGRRSLRSIPAILAYRQPMRRWWFLVPVLFAAALALAIAWSPLGEIIGGWLKGIYPHWMLPDYDGTAGFAKPILVTVLMVTLIIDGIVNPIVEELFFRGYLLSRLPVTGRGMIPLGASLFAVQHYWQPYNWGLIFMVELLLITLVVHTRSVRLGIAMHVLANSFGILATLVGILG